jgi:hypothetical protein
MNKNLFTELTVEEQETVTGGITAPVIDIPGDAITTNNINTILGSAFATANTFIGIGISNVLTTSSLQSI